MTLLVFQSTEYRYFLVWIHSLTWFHYTCSWFCCLSCRIEGTILSKLTVHDTNQPKIFSKMCFLCKVTGRGSCSLQVWRTVAHRQRRGAWVRPRRSPDSAVWALLYAAKLVAALETNLPVSSVNISLIPQKDDYACNLTTCHINLGSLRLLLIRLSKHGSGGGGGIVERH